MPRPVSLVVNNMTLECSVWDIKIVLGHINCGFITLYTGYIVICCQIVAKSHNFSVIGPGAEGMKTATTVLNQHTFEE